MRTQSPIVCRHASRTWDYCGAVKNIARLGLTGLLGTAACGGDRTASPADGSTSGTSAMEATSGADTTTLDIPSSSTGASDSSGVAQTTGPVTETTTGTTGETTETGEQAEPCLNMLAARIASTDTDSGTPVDCTSEVAGDLFEDCTGIAANACARLLYDEPERGLNPDPGNGDHTGMFLDPAFMGGRDLHCVDGSRPIFWVDHAVDAETGLDVASDNWVFTFPGGKVCGPVDRDRDQRLGGPDDSYAGEDCWTLYAPSLDAPAFNRQMTSIGAQTFRTLGGDAGDRGGIHATSSPTPGFQHYNRVRIHKCNYDRFSGNRVVEIDDSTGARPGNGNADYPLYFQGHEVVRAVMAQLAAGVTYPAHPSGGGPTTLPSLADADRVVLVGHSNGSRGLTYTMDAISEDLSAVAPAVQVYGVIDARLDPSVTFEACAANSSGAPHSMYDAANPECQHSGELPPANVQSEYGADVAFRDSGDPAGANGNVAYQNLYWGVELDASCVLAHPDDPSTCQDYAHVMFNHLATPTFFRQALEDSTHSSNGGRPKWARNPMYEWDGGAGGVTPFRARVFAQAVDFLTNAPAMHDDPEALYTYPRGFFVDASSIHVGALTDEPFLCHLNCAPGNTGCINYQTALRTWVEDGVEVVSIAGYQGWTWGGIACP